MSELEKQIQQYLLDSLNALRRVNAFGDLERVNDIVDDLQDYIGWWHSKQVLNAVMLPEFSD